MVGKFFLIAFLCVSLAQVQGNELQEAIKNGLNKVKQNYETGQSKINASIQKIDNDRRNLGRKTIGFMIKAIAVQQNNIRALRENAKAMEEKAKQLNKTQSVFDCITKTEKNATLKIQACTDKLHNNLKNLEKVAADNIVNVTKTLYNLKEELNAEYKKVVKAIQACKTVSCVENNVTGCNKWLNLMNGVIDQIFKQVRIIITSYEEKAGNLLSACMREVTQIKFIGIAKIKKCVFG